MLNIKIFKKTKKPTKSKSLKYFYYKLNKAKYNILNSCKKISKISNQTPLPLN
ncbi:hypothetical protein HMPREF0078_1532 [Anaerococcus vaginalis ATCC 51170]|uniref:Uncharacterized protein n=1 Tax=Anaerococcus vaginalis ATCC 51170 TaxID=655811 RepID=C7HW81_9FIRM|nr:hypothetical protein HMPREF0078_1532 [Anaerococcus vaginalis ATCC 51170]